MALLSQGTTSRHKHFFFLKGDCGQTPLNRKKKLQALWSVFSPSSFHCQLTIWSQMDVKLYVDTEPIIHKHLSRKTLPSVTSQNSHRTFKRHSLTPREDVTETHCLSAFLYFLPRNASSTRPTKQTTRSIAPICPHTLPSECDTATLERSVDKDRTTLTVHIHTFENTLQHWTHIRPTECTRT